MGEQMTNHAIKNQKDQLAKLMATENLTIVHKKVPTAYFDMKNRILCCPILKDDLSTELYDLFMGHEVGHALNTPYEGVHSALTKNKTLKGYLNVVEDVRIEKDIKYRYQGLKRSFFTAYNELVAMDFFGIKDKDLNELAIIDKINLITKVGHRINIALSPEEQVFLDMAEACKTWDEVEICANAIYEWSKENETRNEDDEAITPETLPTFEDEDGEYEEDENGNPMDDDGDYENKTSGSGDDGEDEDDSDSLPDAPDYGNGDSDEEPEEGEDGDGEDEEEAGTPSQTKTTGKEGGQGSRDDYDDEDGARESITEHHAHNNEDQFISDDNTTTTTILLKDEFKKWKNFKDTTVTYKQMIEDWDTEFWTITEANKWELNDELLSLRKAKAIHTSKKLRDKNKKMVAHMAKEFEMKQTAMRSAKAFQGKTGKLDMVRLAKYQIVDDIFKKVTYLHDGKNHGLNVLLDWSGSISAEAGDLIEQAMILAEFCRKVNIPHRVYLFSDVYQMEDADGWGRTDNPRLIELFSDKMSGRDYNKNHMNLSQLWNNFFITNRNHLKMVNKYNSWFDGVHEVKDYGWVDFDDHATLRPYRLGGTPLDHGITAMRCLLPIFNAEYNIEKSILTVITDGYSHSSPVFNDQDHEYDDRKAQATDGEPSYRSHSKRMLIDPFTNKSYPYSDNSAGRWNQSFLQTQNLLDWVAQETGVIVTGYFCLGNKKDLWALKENIGKEMTYMDTDTIWRTIRKEGISLKCHGYNKLFLTSSNALSVEGEDELSDDLQGANKRKLMSAFKKNQKSKTTSRFLTNEFIKEIA